MRKVHDRRQPVAIRPASYRPVIIACLRPRVETPGPAAHPDRSDSSQLCEGRLTDSAPLERPVSYDDFVHSMRQQLERRNKRG